VQLAYRRASSRDGDRNCPLSAAERLVARLPDARLHVWTDADHLAAYRKQGEILDELLGRS
jgi:pimeloyl-ACP methyl ester carboxylesterase